MKYVIIGAGGVGAAIGAYMTLAKKDVILIARNEHLRALQTKGLQLENSATKACRSIPVKASSMEDFKDKADVIFVCVKGYSIESVVPFINKMSHKKTVVIPILNVYGTGSKLQEQLPNLDVLDGCIYVASELDGPGTVWMKANILKVVYGPRDHNVDKDMYQKIDRDLSDSQIETVLSSNVQKDTFEKFTYISPAATCGLYYRASAGDMQKCGEIRDCFIELNKEILEVAEALGIHYEKDMVQKNLNLLDSLESASSTSMQRDALSNKVSEIDGIVYEVIRMADTYRLELPMYRKLAQALEIYRK